MQQLENGAPLTESLAEVVSQKREIYSSQCTGPERGVLETVSFLHPALARHSFV